MFQTLLERGDLPEVARLASVSRRMRKAGAPMVAQAKATHQQEQALKVVDALRVAELLSTMDFGGFAAIPENALYPDQHNSTTRAIFQAAVRPEEKPSQAQITARKRALREALLQQRIPFPEVAILHVGRDGNRQLRDVYGPEYRVSAAQRGRPLTLGDVVFVISSVLAYEHLKHHIVYSVKRINFEALANGVLTIACEITGI